MNWDALADTVLKVVAILGLVALNGFFVSAEFAFVKLRVTQVEALAAKGHRGARVALQVAHNLEWCISATQIGITLCGVATGALVKPVFQTILAPVFTLLNVTSPAIKTSAELTAGFVVSIFLLIVIGELVPKSLAIRKTLPVSLWTARPLAAFYRLTYPFIWILNHSAQSFLRLLGIAPASENEQDHSEEELRLLFTTAAKRQGASTLGRSLLLNALDIRHRVVGQVMRPRRDIMVLNTQANLAECLEIAERTRYSRFPLCEDGDLDRTLGVVHIKDLYAQRQRLHTGADLVQTARKIIFVPETAHLERLLGLFMDRKLHLALVVDEYGGTLGMVTLEDLLEELVGEIQDEFDQEKPLVVPAGNLVWEIDGILPTHELADLVGEPLHETGITTTSGLITQRLGGFPRVGDVLLLGLGCELRVEATEGTRVTRARLSKRPPS